MRRLSLGLMVGLLLGLCVPQAHADDWWRPGTEPLPLHWNLGGAIDVNNPRHIGERSISGAVLPPPAVLDIDGEYNSAATVATLHARGQKVICYIDAGVFEDYRSDAWKFPPEVIGAPDQGWEGSWWLDIRRLDVLLPIMEARIRDWCAAKGFDGVEADEVDGWENNTGFPLTYNDQLTYNRAIADLIHKHGMAAIQKGDIIQTEHLVDSFDAALVEECARYRECENPWNPDTGLEQIGSQAYTQAGKAVWLAEYRNTDYNRMCSYARRNGWNAAQYKLGLPLSGGRKPC